MLFFNYLPQHFINSDESRQMKLLVCPPGSSSLVTTSPPGRGGVAAGTMEAQPGTFVIFQLITEAHLAKPSSISELKRRVSRDGPGRPNLLGHA